MHDKADIHRKCVYAFAEIQNPKQVLKIWFSLSQQISAEGPIEKMQYKTEIHRKFVYASAEIQNPKQVPEIWFSVSQPISAEVMMKKYVL